MTTFESYVPTLLNFRDNSLVYSSDELQRLQEHVVHPSNGIVDSVQGSEFKHELSTDLLPVNCNGIQGDEEAAKCVERVEVYYYHHRIVLKYVFRNLPEDPVTQRSARRLILAHSRHILITRFVNRINSAGLDGGPLPNELGRVTAYYSYCILFVPLETKSYHKSGLVKNVENLLGSHTFRIVEVTPKILERDRVHIVRISIPSMNVYSTGEIEKFLRVDILNAIYQHMLYSKKDQDAVAEDMRDLTEFSIADLDNRNVMQEAQLHALWDHAVDALGGRMVDLQGVHQQTLLFRASILALLLALVGIVLTIMLAIYHV